MKGQLAVEFEETKDVNLWEDRLQKGELQQIMAMLVDMAGFKIVRGKDTGRLWIQPQYGQEK